MTDVLILDNYTPFFSGWINHPPRAWLWTRRPA
jgi:hypothetical protein